MFISVILHATGRDTFYYSLLSIKDQLRPMDEVIVVADRPTLAARKIYLNTMGLRGAGYYESATPLATGTQRAEGVWLMYVTDDTLLMPGALDVIRMAAQRQELEDPPHPLMFRTQYPHGIILQDVLVPYNQNLGAFDTLGGNFVSETIHLQGTPVEYEDVVQLNLTPITRK